MTKVSEEIDRIQEASPEVDPFVVVSDENEVQLIKDSFCPLSPCGSILYCPLTGHLAIVGPDSVEDPQQAKSYLVFSDALQAPRIIIQPDTILQLNPDANEPELILQQYQELKDFLLDQPTALQILSLVSRLNSIDEQDFDSALLPERELLKQQLIQIGRDFMHSDFFNSLNINMQNWIFWAITGKPGFGSRDQVAEIQWSASARILENEPIEHQRAHDLLKQIKSRLINTITPAPISQSEILPQAA